MKNYLRKMWSISQNGTFFSLFWNLLN